MAIVDNILGFSLKKTINNIIIDNLSEDIPRVMTATLFLQQNCSNTSFKQTSSNMIVEDVLSIQIPKIDGTYKLRLTFTKNTGEFINKEYLFTTYKNLLESFIEDTQDILCDLNCNNCEEKDKKLKESRLVLNMMSYYILNKEYYSKIFNIGLDCIKCTILDNINSNRVNNSFYGKKHSLEMRKHLSLMAKARTTKPTNSRKVRIENRTFESVSDAAKGVGVCSASILFRIKSKNKKFSEYSYIS